MSRTSLAARLALGIIPCVVAVMAACGAAWCDEPVPPSDPPKPAQEQPTTDESPAADPPSDELDELLKGLETSDVIDDSGESDAGDSPFSKISGRMRLAEELLSRAEGVKTAPLHEEIVKDLDALIEKMQKQCEACKGGGKSGAGGGSKKSGGSTGGGGGGASAGGPARDSTSNTRDMENRPVERAAGRNGFFKALWGGLPPREQQEKLRQLQDEEFVPEFEQLTEEYFKALTGAAATKP